MTEETFRKEYIIRDGDICIREIAIGRMEVSVYDNAKADWNDEPVTSTQSITRRLQSYRVLGTWKGWTYYRLQN